MPEEETNAGGDGPPSTHQEEPLVERRPWWAIPLAFAGAFALRHLGRLGQQKPRQKPPAPAGKRADPEQIKDADFKVKE